MALKQSIKQKASKADGAKFIRAVLELEDYWRLMIILFASGLLAGLLAYAYARPTYSSNSIIRINQYVDSTKVAQGISYGDRLLFRTLVKQLSSGTLVLEAAKSLNLIGEKTTNKELVGGLIPSISIDLIDDAHIELAIFSFEPRVVRELPRALTEQYELNKVSMRNEFRNKAIKRYMDEMAFVRAKVSEQLDIKQKFEEESSLANAQIELERLSNVPVDLIRLRYRKEEMERVKGILDKQGVELGVIGQLSLLTSMPKVSEDRLSAGSIVKQQVSPFTFQSPVATKALTQVVVQPDMVDGIEPWRELEKKKRSVEENMRVTRVKFLDDHPEMIKLKEELNVVSSALELELEVARKAFSLEFARTSEMLVNLEGKMPDYHKANKTFDDKKMGYDLMSKGQLAWDKAYEQLSQQIEGLRFGNDAGSVNLEFKGFVNIRSELPVSPSRSQLAMLGSLLGLGLAFGAPLLLVKLSTTVSNLNEFAESLGILGIGIVPLTDPKVLEELNRSPTVDATVPNVLLENFRLIRSSILLNRSPKGDAKVIMVTSARPSEGKTTVSSNIAWAFSSLGDRTLLIDCDLRRGRVHEATGCSNQPGMTALLTGRALLVDCIQKSPADNLWLLPRGPVLPGTTELLNTGVFSGILDQLKGQFDRIILDTPPVLGLSETTFLQNHAEGIVMVVRANSTPRKDAEDAFYTLGKLGAHFYGMVLNGVDFQKRSNHFNYYYYSASYYEANWDEDPTVTKPISKKS